MKSDDVLSVKESGQFLKSYPYFSSPNIIHGIKCGYNGCFNFYLLFCITRLLLCSGL